MTQKNENKKILTVGNVTTVIKIISLTLSGIIFGLISAFGFKLPFDAYTLSAVIGGIIGAIFSYCDATNPNTIFNKNEDTIQIPVENLTQQQIIAIENFINNAVFDIERNNYIEDIDVAGEYEEGA